MKTILQRSPRQVGAGRNSAALSPNYAGTRSRNLPPKSGTAPLPRASHPWHQLALQWWTRPSRGSHQGGWDGVHSTEVGLVRSGAQGL